MKKIVKKLIDKQTLIFIIGGLIINALCFFIYAFPVKASGNENDIYFPMHQNENNHFSSSCISAIESSFNSSTNFIFVKYYTTTDQGIFFYVIVTPKNASGRIFGEIYSNGYQFSLYTSGDMSGSGCAECRYNDSEGLIWLAQSSIYSFSDSISSSYSTSQDYISNFVLYTNSTSNRGIVLHYGDSEIKEGEARKPFFNHNPEYAINDTPPTQVPTTPNINNYTWNTYNPPAFDNSSVLNALESLGDKIEYNYVYLKDGLHGEIYTLNGNIKAYFEYIGETIQYYGNLIIGNIQDAITNFYENMVSLIEPLLSDVQTFVNFFINPLDTGELTSQLNNSTFVSAVRTTKTQISTFNGMFSNISQPENVVFTIDLSGLWFNGGVSYLDFSILTPVLPFIRLVLGCILLYDLIVTLFTNINSYIGGNSAKNDGG